MSEKSPRDGNVILIRTGRIKALFRQQCWVRVALIMFVTEEGEGGGVQ